MKHVLLIGCGEIAVAGHLPALEVLAREGRVAVTACDVDDARRAAVAQRFGVAVAADWRDVAGADAVVLSAPPAVNAALAVEALDRGLAVLCEKPPGLDTHAAEAMAAAASRNPVVNLIAFNRRFAPLRTHLAAASARFGPAHTFIGRFTRNAIGQEPSNTASDWITSDSIHTLDLAIATIGFPRQFAVERRAVGGTQVNVVNVELFADGATALLAFHFAAGRRHESYEWIGGSYDARLEFPARAEWAQGGRETEALDNRGLGVPAAYAHEWGFVAQHRHFVDAIDGHVAAGDHDFAYGASLMALIDGLLTAPDREITAVAPIGPGQRVAVRKPAAPTPASRRDGRRSVVVVHQPAGMQRRLFAPALLAELGAVADVRTADGDRPFDDADAVITGRGAPPVGDALATAERLGLTVVVGASVRAVEPETLLARGIAVTNTANAVAEIVAEHCLLMALAGLRRLTEHDRNLHAGGWRGPVPKRSIQSTARDLVRRLPAPLRAKLIALATRRAPALVGAPKPNAPAASALAGETVALIGWGHIAHHFVRLLEPFGCDVAVVSDALDPAEAERLGVRLAPLGEAISSARVVSLHKGLTERTRHLLGRNELDLLRPGTVLINTARGPLIDETALVERLQRRDIIAALDVFDDEPLPAKHPLRDQPNAILTPHCASTTQQEERRMGDEALRTVLAWIAGEPISQIDAARLAKMT